MADSIFEDSYDLVVENYNSIKSLPRHVKFWRTLLLIIMVIMGIMFPYTFLIIQGIWCVIIVISIVEELIDDDNIWICAYSLWFVFFGFFIGLTSLIHQVWLWVLPSVNRGKGKASGVVGKINDWIDNFKIIKNKKDV